MANKWDVVVATAKEMRSLKLRYDADLLPFALIIEASTRSRKQKKQRDFEISEGTVIKNYNNNKHS